MIKLPKCWVHNTYKNKVFDKNNLLFIGSGATGLSQVDRVFEEGLTAMIQRVQSLSYHYEGRLELHVIGGFADSRRISQDLSVPLLRKLLFNVVVSLCCEYIVFVYYVVV